MPSVWISLHLRNDFISHTILSEALNIFLLFLVSTISSSDFQHFSQSDKSLSHLVCLSYFSHRIFSDDHFGFCQNQILHLVTPHLEKKQTLLVHLAAATVLNLLLSFSDDRLLLSHVHNVLAGFYNEISPFNYRCRLCLCWWKLGKLFERESAIGRIFPPTLEARHIFSPGRHKKLDLRPFALAGFDSASDGCQQRNDSQRVSEMGKDWWPLNMRNDTRKRNEKNPSFHVSRAALVW